MAPPEPAGQPEVPTGEPGDGDLATKTKPGDEEGRKTVRVYRVETDVPQTQRVLVGAGGSVAVQGTGVLWLGFGTPVRQEEVAAKRLSQGATGVEIRSFEVPVEFFKAIQATAVSEREANRPVSNKSRPILSSDPAPPFTQYGLREP